MFVDYFAPAFLVALQQKHDPKILADRQRKADLQRSKDDDREDPNLEDEAPLVVQLKAGDLSADQAQAVKDGKDPDDEPQTTHIRKRTGTEDVREASADEHEIRESDTDGEGGVKFRRPKAKKIKTTAEATAVGTRKPRDSKATVDPKKRSKVKKIKNTSLLSFEEDE
ncbi:hypothetical protein SARC_00469 [Sphaeroforma arctica JP610]|uniref:DUF4604 domain-containing protein n=1 Tax=Sphaeroforma arctica JP610 TaxID=667725 RepID=A0A0L0GEH8_9EUKA|nr:hypothetical protein SARC_00469 [Sphaeroforma arctica JP610]KNC87432.1 hypothetical protein SARC_00469 [Sphaeroforma arctica JP610]|eukprot:XP_014161334.1 hypothetical protein SARC_00469 [Sphaeroforma arctica JP610]